MAEDGRRAAIVVVSLLFLLLLLLLLLLLRRRRRRRRVVSRQMLCGHGRMYGHADVQDPWACGRIAAVAPWDTAHTRPACAFHRSAACNDPRSVACVDRMHATAANPLGGHRRLGVLYGHLGSWPRVHCSAAPSARSSTASLLPTTKQKTPWPPSTGKGRRALRPVRTLRCRRVASSSGCGPRLRPPSSSTTTSGGVSRPSWPWPAPPSPGRYVALQHSVHAKNH